MDIEKLLLSKVIQTQQADVIISRGIESDHFADRECQEVFETIVEHMREYKVPPSLDAVRLKHPDFNIEISTDALEYLMDQFVNDVKRRKAIEVGRSFRDAIDNPAQVKDIELVALEMARTLTEVVPSPTVSRFSDAELRIQEYDRRLEAGEIYGLLTGVKTFDDLTLGMQSHEFVVILAFLGMGKSTFMQWIFYQTYLQGKTPLMISLEMDADALLRKFDVMATQIKYWAMKALELDTADKDIWYAMAERADADRHEKDIIIIDDVRGCTSDKVMAETIRYKPDLVGIDYIGLMHAPRELSNSWQKMQYITRELKANARGLRIPVLAAAQANRDAAKGDVGIANTAEGLSIAQDCDIMFALQRDEDQEKNNEMEVLMLKNRDGKKGRALMNWELDTMDIWERHPETLMKRRESSKEDDEEQEEVENVQKSPLRKR